MYFKKLKFVSARMFGLRNSRWKCLFFNIGYVEICSTWGLVCMFADFTDQTQRGRSEQCRSGLRSGLKPLHRKCCKTSL